MDCVAGPPSKAWTEHARESSKISGPPPPGFRFCLLSGGEEGKTLRICGVAGKCQSEKVVFGFAVNSSFFASRDLMAFQNPRSSSVFPWFVRETKARRFGYWRYAWLPARNLHLRGLPQNDERLSLRARWRRKS